MLEFKGNGYIVVIAENSEPDLALVGIADLVKKFKLPVNSVLLIMQKYSDPKIGTHRFGIRRVTAGAVSMLNERQVDAEMRKFNIEK